MKSEWETKKIGEVVDIRRGSSPRPIHKFLASEGMPWVKIADATSDTSRYIWKTNEFIIDDGVNKSVKVAPETLIVSNSATPGLPKIMKITACVHDGWLVFSNYRGITRDFLYYKFIDIRRQLVNQANGSVFQNLKTDIVKDFDIDIPSIETQKKIVGILSNIDEKIELNNAINNNLEQQAQAIFEKTFPKIFDEYTSETLKTLITFSNGKKRPKTSGKVPVYGGNGILSYTDQTNAENCVIIGRVGAYCGNTFLCLGKCWVSDNAIQAKSKNEKSQLFIYYLLKNAALPYRHIGTGQPLMTQGILNSIPVNMPSTQKIDNFISICEPIHNIISANNCENTMLESLRDTLLPKLMSGELDVSDIEL